LGDPGELVACVNFTGVIVKTCTQIELICIAVGSTKPHVSMGNRGC
jgi:hypothetical protein